jgi:Putative zinc finger motif, C2HC5-type
MSADLTAWALPRLTRLLPIDEESLREVITYTSSLSKEAGAEHLKNLLGDSAQALEFIASFNARRPDATPLSSIPQTSAPALPHSLQPTTDDGPSQRKRGQKKVKPPLHNAGPVRRPENYGEITGGYNKSSQEEEYMPKNPRQAPSSNSISNALSLSQEPSALQAPMMTNTSQAPSAPQTTDRGTAQGKLPPSASGSLTSDLLNVKSRTSKRPPHSSGSSTPQKSTTTTSSINDLTSAIAALELSTNPSLSSERRKCPCNASIHPLFEPAPNCLSCGKIICALEGLQPCSFCDSPILSKEQVQTMIKALREERG